MNITGIGGLSGTQSQQNIQKSNARLQTAIANLVSGSRLNKASTDIAALSIASQLQSEVASLKQASNNIAQVSSLTQVADGGAEQIQNIIDKMQAVAAQAKSPTLTEDNRKALNEQFQQLRAAIDRFADSTTFNNQKLLDGNLSGDKEISLAGLLGDENDGGEALGINSLTSSNLFNGQSLNLLTPEAAGQATVILGDALNKVTSVRASIGAFQQSLNFAAANIDSAVVNQEAARAILQDSDFAESATESSLANIQRNAAIALAAQGNKLTPNLLKLVS